MGHFALFFLSFALILSSFANAAVTEEDLARFMAPITDVRSSSSRSMRNLAMNLTPFNIGSKLLARLNSSDPSDVVVGLMGVGVLDELASRNIELSSSQAAQVMRAADAHLKSLNPYVRLAAFEHAVARYFRGPHYLSTNNLEVAFLDEQEPVLKEIMFGLLNEIKFRRVQTEPRKVQNVEVDFEKLEDVRVVIASAAWCSICKALERNMQAENVSQSGAMTVRMKNQQIRFPYETLDVDKQRDLVRRMKLDSIVPTIYLVKDNRVLHKGLFAREPLTAKGLESVVERLALEYAKTGEEQKENKTLTERLVRRSSGGSSAVVMFATGSRVDEIPVFSRDTVTDVKGFLQVTGKDPEGVYTFYGSGEESWNDTFGMLGGGYVKMFKADVGSDASFTRGNLASTIEALNQRGTKRSLEVFVGHGTPDGVSLWQDETLLSPEELKSMRSRAKFASVFVSGVCFGGQYAEVPRCGFFAARPDRPAAGCWSEKPQNAKDYTTTFFSTLRPEIGANADANHDGVISFAEAHWYTVLNGNSFDVPYTSFDALVAKEFSTNPSLPGSIKLSEVRALEKFLTAEELVFWKGHADSLLREAQRAPDRKLALRQHKLVLEVLGMKVTMDRPGLAEVLSRNGAGSADLNTIDITQMASEKARLKLELLAETSKTHEQKTRLEKNVAAYELKYLSGRWHLIAHFRSRGEVEEFVPVKLTVEVKASGDDFYLASDDLQMGQLLKRAVLRANKSTITDGRAFADVVSCENQDFRGYLQ